MAGDSGNYARHARYWDWGGYDRTPEHEYWREFAAKYGTNVLSPMCALGETGAYMARHGMNVTAFDIAEEMISEGGKRFGDVPGLALRVGDVCDFAFDMPPADFCFSMDFGALLTIEDVRRALMCIHRHLRSGGCMVVETGLWMPGGVSDDFSEPTKFYPLAQPYPGLKVWKTGTGRIDAELGRHYIRQTFYAEDESGHIDSFDHSFYMQSYAREDWLAAFEACGFELAGEYAERNAKSWQDGGEGFRIFELIKRGG